MKVREDNPFEQEEVAREWINSVENERGLIRDNELYPLLINWASKVQPKTIVEIGSGQGILADKVQLQGTKYIGIEPSSFLVERAKEIYSHADREFVVGNAYNVPLADDVADTVLSVNVWFHLEDLAGASKELFRILKPGGNFLIVTSNPASNDAWEGFFLKYDKDGKKLDGKIRVPINPLTRSLMFLHSLEEIKEALTQAGLNITTITEFGYVNEDKSRALFVWIEGRKR